MKDCEGCGYTFKTGRGDRGNWYMIDYIIHVCSYCKHATIVELLPVRKSRPS